jgi:2-dehydropantoate 2-reductase
MSGTVPAVAVVGAGGIGSLFAANVAATGARVVVCVRRPFAELVVTELDGTVRTAAVEVASDAAEVGSVDWILLATKAHQTAGTEPWLRALRGSHTRIAVLQNGVEHIQRVRPFVGDATVVPVIVHPAVVATEPGRVRVTLAARSFVPVGRDGRDLAALVGSGDCAIEPVEDFAFQAWWKLANNIPAAAITTMLLVSVNTIGRIKPLQEFARQLVEECRAVAHAEDVELPDSLGDAIVDRFAAFDTSITSSMSQDRMRGIEVEADAIFGPVVRAGNRHGIATPLTSAVLAVLSGIGGHDLIRASPWR